MAKAALAILAFAVVMWVTEAVTYPVSATLILGFNDTFTRFKSSSRFIRKTSETLKVAT